MARRRTPARFSKAVAEFVTWERVCRVATAGAAGIPHVVPVCHVLAGGKLYFGSGKGRKMKNVAENPNVTVVIDAYSDAWSTLRGVMVQGRATAVVSGGPRFRRLRDLLYRKYPQYPRGDAALSPSDSVIVEVTPTRVFSWGFR